MTASTRATSADPNHGTDACMRDCPTLQGDSRSLIVHRIDVPLCMRRQREHYHKCHRCLYRGQPASFVAEEPLRLVPTGASGVPSQRVELPAARR